MTLGLVILNRRSFNEWRDKYQIESCYVISGYKTIFLPEYVYVPNRIGPKVCYCIPKVYLNGFLNWLFSEE